MPWRGIESTTSIYVKDSIREASGGGLLHLIPVLLVLRATRKCEIARASLWVNGSRVYDGRLITLPFQAVRKNESQDIPSYGSCELLCAVLALRKTRLCKLVPQAIINMLVAWMTFRIHVPELSVNFCSFA